MFLPRFSHHVFQLFALFQCRVKDGFLNMRVGLEFRLNLIKELFSLVRILGSVCLLEKFLHLLMILFEQL